MKWLLHCPGLLSHGYGSPCRGEGRWSLNLAHTLAEHGHDVTVVGIPGAGEVPGCKVRSLRDSKVERESFDVLHDTTWHEDRLRYKSDLYIHAYWSIDEKWTELRQDYDHRHWCAYATLQQVPSILSHPDGIVGRLMPFPAVKEFASYDNFDTPGIFWDVKYGFEDDWTVKRNIVSHAMLTLALDIADEFGLEVYILHAEHVLGGWCQGPVKANIRSELKDRLLTSKNVRLFEEFPDRAAVMDLLAQSRLVVNNNDPPISPLPIEAVSVGCVPLQWETSIFLDTPWRLGQTIRHIADPNYFATEVKNKVRALLSNKEQYLTVLESYRAAATPYLYENAYRTSLESVKDMLARISQWEILK